MKMNLPYQIRDTLPNLQDPRIKKLRDYWAGLARDGAMPRRSDLDPIALKDVLEIIWLYEYENSPVRFRCRLAGEAVNARYDGGIGRRYLDDFFSGKLLHDVQAHYLAVLDMPCIGYSIGRVYGALGKIGFGERILLPMSDEFGQPRFVLGATNYVWGRPPTNTGLDHDPGLALRISVPFNDLLEDRPASMVSR